LRLEICKERGLEIVAEAVDVAIVQHIDISPGRCEEANHGRRKGRVPDRGIRDD
jgi:hypothetical protein